MWERSQEAYQRSLQVAGFLGWRPVVIKASWGLGCLLLQHVPEEQRTEAPPWWDRWDALFRTAISLERELGWILYQPEIHRSRFSFIEKRALEHSIEDGYNILKSVQQARYPRKVFLEWHDRVKNPAQ